MATGQHWKRKGISMPQSRISPGSALARRAFQSLRSYSERLGHRAPAAGNVWASLRVVAAATQPSLRSESESPPLKADCGATMVAWAVGLRDIVVQDATLL